MDIKIKIFTSSTGYVPAEITTEKNPITAQAICDALPIHGRVNKWGDEIYFSIPVTVPVEKAREEVEAGDLAFWPPGNGFCIFFGRTPASTSEKPRAASPVNVFGRVSGDATIFRRTRSSEEIRIEKT
jgi:hypothetical protein